MTPDKNRAAATEQDAPGFRIVRQFPDPADEGAWRNCLSQSDWPSHYASPEFFAEPFWAGMRPFAVLALEGDRVTGVLTGLHENGCVVSGNPWRPQICFDRAFCPSRTAVSLARGLLAEAGSAGLASIFAWTRLDALQPVGFRTKPFEGSVILDLTRGSEFLFGKLHPNRRRNVRYAIKHGVEVFQAVTQADFSSYYEVYQTWRQTSRKQIVGVLVPYSTLEQALGLTGNRMLLLARYKGKIIAGDVLRFYPGGLVEASGNSSNDEFLHLKPNDLLVWKAIEWACDAGFNRMSLGGAHHFLREFGGGVVPIYRHRRDATWFHRHDLRDTMADPARRLLQRAPVLDRVVRRLLGKT